MLNNIRKIIRDVKQHKKNPLPIALGNHWTMLRKCWKMTRKVQTKKTFDKNGKNIYNCQIYVNILEICNLGLK
jgi:hypothetical protein